MIISFCYYHDSGHLLFRLKFIFWILKPTKHETAGNLNIKSKLQIFLNESIEMIAFGDVQNSNVVTVISFAECINE